MTVKYITCHRRGTAQKWAEKSTVIPREGEIVIEIDEVNSLHKLKIGDGVHTYAELAYLMAGDEIVTQVLAQALPRVVTVTLDVDQWVKVTSETDPNLGYYEQVITIDDVTEHSRLDLQPNADMLVEFKSLNLVFVTENKGGTITVYSVGDMPSKSYTMQATIVETDVKIDSNAIIGTPVGTPASIKDTIPKTAYTHNAIYRGKNLTNIYTIDEICAMISAGTFDDLFIGDYFDITISSEYTASETVRCVFAGFDIYYGRNVLFENKHHAVIIPNDCFESLAAMNSTATTSGAFLSTDMMQTILPVYESALTNVLGDHMITFETVVTSAISTDGASNAGAGFTGCSSQTTGRTLAINLLSEIQVYGSSIFSSSCYEYQKSGDVRFPIFALHPQFVIPNLSVADNGVSTYRQCSYWLRNVVSSTQFAVLNCIGYFGADCAAANLKYGVRPYFLIG